jgi:hypothetical protein
MEKVHACSGNTFDDVRIVFDKINVEEKAWFCEQTWYATKYEVEDKLANEIGSKISFHIFPVNYCPFCGVKLNDL